MAARIRQGAGAAIGLILLAACASDDADGDRADAPTEAPTATGGADRVALVAELDPSVLSIGPPIEGATPVEVGFFIALRSTGAEEPPVADAGQLLRELIEGADRILAQCDLSLRAEAAQIIVLPNRLVRFQANDESSFGGHPPPGTENPELFTYRRNERLTDDARELFAYGKRHTSPNTIGVFTVGTVVYFAAQELTPAGGVSFPPNAFHHEDDYPLRNALVLVPDYLPRQLLPARIRPDALAHELAHMLLNSGEHVTVASNLMGEGGGTLLTNAQCERMRENNELLFGVAEIADPGPP